MRKESIFSRRRGCQLKFLIKLKPSSSIFTAPGFISSEAARDLKPITEAASDPGSSLQSKAWHPSLFLSFLRSIGLIRGPDCAVDIQDPHKNALFPPRKCQIESVVGDGWI